jgi:hypothetical protein
MTHPAHITFHGFRTVNARQRLNLGKAVEQHLANGNERASEFGAPLATAAADCGFSQSRSARPRHIVKKHAAGMALLQTCYLTLTGKVKPQMRLHRSS